MPKRVNISEAKTRLSALIAAVEATREPVLICRNGRVVAELAPASGSRLVLGDLAGKYEGPGADIRGVDEDVLAEWGEA